MNAKKKNASDRSLFFNGGRLDILFFDECPSAQPAKVHHFRPQDFVLAECPCGCGLVGDVCASRRASVAAANEALEF